VDSPLGSAYRLRSELVPKLARPGQRALMMRVGRVEGERERMGGWKRDRNDRRIMLKIYMSSMRSPLLPLPCDPSGGDKCK